jgi:uncharacterized coiled-coil protein SlyX
MKPETMSSTPTAAERAEKRLQRLDKETVAMSIDKYDSFATRGAYRNGYATCIREDVEPLEAKLAEQSKALESLSGTLSEYREEIDQLRALGDSMCEALRRAEQDLIDWKRQGIALRGESEEGIQRGLQGCIPHAQGIMYTDTVANECYSAFRAWQEHKSQGFTPTNTTDK